MNCGDRPAIDQPQCGVESNFKRWPKSIISCLPTSSARTSLTSTPANHHHQPIKMKFLIVLCIAFVACAVAAPTNEEQQHHQVAAESQIAEEELVREKKSYGAAPSYGAPSYAPAPSYSAPSYAPPRLGPSKSYSYGSPAPTIPCGQALVFSCAPSVANAPCQSYGGSYGGGYGGSGY